MCCLCADNQFRMSILERLEQMERRMAEMAARDNNNQQQHHHCHHHQQQHHGNQLATPPPPPLPEDHEQVRMVKLQTMFSSDNQLFYIFYLCINQVSFSVWLVC